MKKISIFVLFFIGLVAIHGNSIQIDDQGDFEEGKFFFFVFYTLLTKIYIYQSPVSILIDKYFLKLKKQRLML